MGNTLWKVQCQLLLDSDWSHIYGRDFYKYEYAQLCHSLTWIVLIIYFSGSNSVVLTIRENKN